MVIRDRRSSTYMSHGPSCRVEFIQDTLSTSRMFAVTPMRVICSLMTVAMRSEEHTSELQSLTNIVCRLLLEKKKKRRDVEIWLVSRDNFMLFTPLLPEVCSGVLEPRHVVTPLRGMLHHQSTWCITAEVDAIDTQGHVVTVIGGDGDPHRLHYDTLVLALG